MDILFAFGEILLSPVFIASTHLMCNKMQKKYKQTASLIIVCALSLCLCVSYFWNWAFINHNGPMPINRTLHNMNKCMCASKWNVYSIHTYMQCRRPWWEKKSNDKKLDDGIGIRVTDKHRKRDVEQTKVELSCNRSSNTHHASCIVLFSFPLFLTDDIYA